ncbi:LOW QUALITY PROTEIN: hypothetical protein HID58_040146 [Brassica napus]|uniref:Uncharacterized protein n=1 Tax=Brassica napus TaxID=3708 RepID=A0ABQ8B7F3_BRANA|nr:LOW QUALITY PROTEIN: hypothetical protein HID58_040146 [Brassica napus]
MLLQGSIFRELFTSSVGLMLPDEVNKTGVSDTTLIDFQELHQDRLNLLLALAKEYDVNREQISLDERAFFRGSFYIMRLYLKPTYETLFEMLKYSSWRVAFFCPSYVFTFIIFSITIISKTTSGLYALVIIIHLFMFYTHVSLIVTSLDLLQLLHYVLTSYNAFGQGGDNNLGDDTPGASCVSCICSKNHKLSATDQATGSGGFHLLKQQELRKTQSGAQQRSHMFQQQRGSLRRNPKHRC